jgi:hypothetical protein
MQEPTQLKIEKEILKEQTTLQIAQQPYLEEIQLEREGLQNSVFSTLFIKGLYN